MNTSPDPITHTTTAGGRTAARTAVGLAALALVAAACGAGSADSAPTEPAVTAPPTSTTEPAGEPAGEPTATAATESDSASGAVEMTIQVEFGGSHVVGTFEVGAGADVLGCERGTTKDLPGEEYIERIHTCEVGERTGRFRMSFQPGSAPGPGDDNSHWEIISGTDDYEGLAGQGRWSVVYGDGTGAETVSGRVGHGPDADVELTPAEQAARDAEEAFAATPATALLATVDRLRDPDDPCTSYESPGGEPTKLYGLVATDGLHEYRTIGETTLVNDLVTGDVTELGAAPVPCALVVGDDASGRQVAASQDGDRFWVGPLGGQLTEVEIDVDAPAMLLSRQITNNRFLVVSGSDEQATVSLIDATSGAVVGTVGDLFLPFPAWAISPDGERVVIGSAVRNRPAGDGLTYVLDAATGADLFTVDTPAPAMAVAWDAATGELLLGTADGHLVTVDASGEIVHRIELGTRSDVHAVGPHPDGSVVVATGTIVARFDRASGPIGDPVDVANAVGGRIRPDGTALLWDWHDQGHVIDPAAG